MKNKLKENLPIIFLTIALISCLVMVHLVLSEKEVETEAQVDYNVVFRDTSLQLYEGKLLESHFEACRKVATETTNKDLALDCYEKAKIMGVFNEPYEPMEMFYTYPIDSGTYISQTPREHYGANGIWATDIATGGVASSMYAPDIRNKAVEYIVSYEENYMEHYGRALVLTSGMERFVIGHIDGVVEGSVSTGEYIGDTSMSGISTGYHAHIEYWTGITAGSSIVWNQTEYKVDPNYNPHQVILDKAKKKGDDTHLAWDSEQYQGYDTPWQILSAIHLTESGRQKVQEKTSSAGATGTMQFMPNTWDSYCSDLDNGILKDDIICADRYLQANLKIKKNWIKTIWQYNHSNYYVATILDEARIMGLEINDEQKEFISYNK